MGRKRQDRTIEEWTVYGSNLLDIIGKKHRTYYDIETTISRLISETTSKTKQELTNKLNSHKDNLGKHWLRWTKKIKQKPKDENRSKFYIENKTYNKILRFIELDKETKKLLKISDNEVFNRIFKLLYSFGIHNESEMKLILDELEKFKSGILERNSTDTLTDEDGYQGQTSKIIHAILKELGDKQISSFEKLKSIKKYVRNKEINKLEGEIESLKNKIKILEDKLEDDDDDIELDE